jgi:hypothetical protein
LEITPNIIMADRTGVSGLMGLFSVCLEGYKICLAISGADEDAKILRTRMFLEKERFLNVGKTCGLLPLHRQDRKTEALKKFLQEDPFRRKAVADTLELIANLLCKAEHLDRKYVAEDGIPEALKNKVSIRYGCARDDQNQRNSLTIILADGNGLLE